MPDSGRKPEPDPNSRLKSMYIHIKYRNRTDYILFEVIKKTVTNILHELVI